MVLASTLTELVVKLTPQFVEPSVVVDGGTGPDGAGMVEVCDLVALVSIRAVSHTMSRGHKLCILDDHLATMLITMPFCTNTRVLSEEEDVHGYILAEDHRNGKKEIPLLERLQANPRKSTLLSRLVHEGSLQQARSSPTTRGGLDP